MNPERGSSLKNFKFEGWTSDKIVEKYETVLASREKQIADLSIVIGQSNEKINQLNEKLNELNKENVLLKERLSKKEKILQQELANKEIMFMRLEKKDLEYDDLKKKYDELTKNNNNNNVGKSDKFGNLNSFFSGAFNKIVGNLPIKKNQDKNNDEIETNYNNKSNDKNIVDINNIHTKIGNYQTSPTPHSEGNDVHFKSSARDRLKALKDKTQGGNKKKLNFSELLQKKQEENTNKIEDINKNEDKIEDSSEKKEEKTEIKEETTEKKEETTAIKVDETEKKEDKKDDNVENKEDKKDEKEENKEDNKEKKEEEKTEEKKEEIKEEKKEEELKENKESEEKTEELKEEKTTTNESNENKKEEKEEENKE